MRSKKNVALSDLNQPYSCSQWGNMGTSGIPNIIDDPSYQLFNMFGSGAWPSLVFIDHEMRVHYKEAGYYPTFTQDASERIDDMLFNMENTLILYNEMFLTIDDSSDDGDNILNPGESFNIDFIISNNSFYLDAFNVTASISCENSSVNIGGEILGINIDITDDGSPCSPSSSFA